MDFFSDINLCKSNNIGDRIMWLICKAYKLLILSCLLLPGANYAT